MAVIDVDVWIWPLGLADTDVRRLEMLLSDDERKRAARFLAPTHGAEYIAGRGRLREILALYTGQPPEHLAFAYGGAGKPVLMGGDGMPQFNLSHSGGWAALAVTAKHTIGIDIEATRPVTEDIAERFFSPAEVRAISAYAPVERPAAFFRCWTRKEAFVKALGDGLNCPLDSFDVSIVDEDRPAVQRIAGVDASELACWRLINFTPAANVAGAIALKTGGADDLVAVHFHG